MANETKLPFPQRTAACDDWSVLFPDAVEDLLSDVELQALHLHVAGCAACERELTEAQRGAAWLSLLKEHPPEPPRDMVAGILARTSGAALLPEVVPQELAYLQPVAPLLPAWQPEATPSAAQRLARWLGLGERTTPALQPRLTMTAAMAFFSICVTLNLLGISVTQLHAESLRPATLQRSVAGKGERLLRSFTGMRVVYQVEARVNDWLAPGETPGGIPGGTPGAAQSHHGLPQ